MFSAEAFHVTSMLVVPTALAPTEVGTEGRAESILIVAERVVSTLPAESADQKSSVWVPSPDTATVAV